MNKLEQMDELIMKVQKDEALQKEVAAILQTENLEDTAKADQWLADNGYEFTLKELIEHMEDGIPLSDEQLEAVAGGKDSLGSFGQIMGAALGVGVGGIVGIVACVNN